MSAKNKCLGCGRSSVTLFCKECVPVQNTRLPHYDRYFNGEPLVNEEDIPKYTLTLYVLKTGERYNVRSEAEKDRMLRMRAKNRPFLLR